MEGNAQAAAWDLDSQRGLGLCDSEDGHIVCVSFSEDLSGNETSQEDAAYQNIICSLYVQKNL